ncbi:hypothetical protein cypCar_00013803 [Cyprinus carpio]|nr:hypothetical protein cypCar_00013803 [Cyprinus carpio]
MRGNIAGPCWPLTVSPKVSEDQPRCEARFSFTPYGTPLAW